jgi:DNA-binding GntR family transcriptional regulator
MTEFTTGRLRPVSLREQALQVIRHALSAAEVHPGEIYSAAGLAAKLGVSNSPVREAMLELVHLGVMEPVRNRGFRVVELTEQDLDEVCELRIMLEVPAMGRIAALHLGAKLEHLVPLAAETEAAVQAGDIPRFLDADRAFHLAVLDLTGNKRLVATVAALRDQTRLWGLGGRANRHELRESAGEHRKLLAALGAGDGTAAQELMGKHLRDARRVWHPPA